MLLGKSIRIYLADGSVSGIRHGEIVNWTGQAIACPRSRFQELKEWPETKRPGVYFLFGTDEESGQDAVYIGEAEVVIDRLYSHISGKDFWSDVIVFTNKDENLTKGHVRYLESRIINIASTCGRYKVKNTATPQTPSLPRADRDAMEEYIESTRTLLGVLGHKVLEPLISTSSKPLSHLISTDAKTKFITQQEFPERSTAQTTIPLKLNTSCLSAYASMTDEGIVVLAESEAASTSQPSLSIGQRNLREKLCQDGILTNCGSKLKFSRDYLFNSASQAAAIVVGSSKNGREAWKLPDGTTLKAYEDSLAITNNT